jgi:ribonuclease BN (tRNA processing enzyme)
MRASVIEFADDSELLSFPVYHGFGKVNALAFRLVLASGRVVAYSGDTGTCPGLIQAAKDADLFICEASAPLGNDAMATGYGHLNPRQAGEVAKVCGVKKLVLTHYSGRDPDEAMLVDCRLSGFEGEIVIAKDGDQYLLD